MAYLKKIHKHFIKSGVAVFDSLTGARSGEVREAVWSEIDHQG